MNFHLSKQIRHNVYYGNILTVKGSYNGYVVARVEKQQYKGKITCAENATIVIEPNDWASIERGKRRAQIAKK